MKKICGLVLSVMCILMLIMPAEYAAAEDTGYSVDVALYLKESYNEWSWNSDDGGLWSEPASEAVTITSDGRFSLKLEGLNIPGANLCLCYIKDAAVFNKTATASNVPEDIVVVTEKVIVNGKSMRVGTPERTGLRDNAFDVCYHNEWAESDSDVDFTSFDSISTIEVIFTVSGLGGDFDTNIEATATPTEAPTATPASDSSSTAVVSGNDAVSSGMSVSGIIITCAVGVVAIVIIIVVLMTALKKKK